MILSEIQNIIEEWAPKEIAWERDNVGIQIGSQNSIIHKILVTLDVTPPVIDEAIKKRVDLIISHHPIFFNPLKSINLDTTLGIMIFKLVRNNIAVYSSHTNLDFTHDGVSFALAQKMGLKDIDFLLKNQSINRKIVAFVPSDYSKIVIEAMAKEGAGIIGEYETCSFKSIGTGSFKASNKAKPYVGEIGKLETVDEMRVEMIVPQWKLSRVIASLKRVHPYEEVAFDVYPLLTPSTSYGAGAIGNLPRSMNQKEFLKYVLKRLPAKMISYNKSNSRSIKRVAMCGGNGSDMIQVASQNGADAFITGDISYHRFTDTPQDILLIDAGHFETEQPVVPVITNFLKKELKNRNSNIQIFESKNGVNPINYFIS
jgi:dinuclear metal center YbgI/SA1388 family protein